MSNTLGPSQNVKPTRSTLMKPSDLKNEDLQLVAERLALIQGHMSKMPDGCISGATVLNGFLLVALKINGHEFAVSGTNWLLDGKDVTVY
jgi:hypothetical protein